MTIPGEGLTPNIPPANFEAGEVDHAARFEADPSILRVTAIFSRHLTPEDAQAIAAQIRPGSIVFSEGMTMPNETLDDKIIHQAFESKEYSNLLAELLLEKGCRVALADFNAEKYGSDIINNRTLFQGMIHPFRDLDPARTTKPHLHKAVKHTDTHYSMQTLREEIAVQEVIEGTTALLADESLRELALDEEGNPHVYILFGSAHQNSLENAFSEEGITLEKVVLDDTPDHIIIPVSLSEHTQNRRRRLGHDALAELIRQDNTFTPEDREKLIEASYGKLAYLNEDRDLSFAFLAEALKIRRTATDNPAAAHEKLASTLSGLGIELPGPHQALKQLPSRYVYHDKQVLIQVPHS